MMYQSDIERTPNTNTWVWITALEFIVFSHISNFQPIDLITRLLTGIQGRWNTNSYVIITLSCCSYLQGWVITKIQNMLFVMLPWNTVYLDCRITWNRTKTFWNTCCKVKCQNSKHHFLESYIFFLDCKIWQVEVGGR